MIRHTTRSHLRNTLAALLVATIVAPSVYLGSMPPNEAHAQASAAAGMGACAIGPAISGFLGSIGSFIASGTAAGSATLEDGYAAPFSVPEASVNIGQAVQQGIGTAGTIAQVGIQGQDLFIKCVLNPLVWALKEMLIRSITNSILDWINNGFDGAPTFLTDPKNFFREVADTAVSAYLFESGLDELLCSPFRIDIIFDLAMDWERSRNPKFGQLSCSLDEIFSEGIIIDSTFTVSNRNRAQSADDMYDRMVRRGEFDFVGGGFPAFFEMLKPQNNAYGAYLGAQSEAMRRAERARSNEADLLAYADGWFSMRCDMDGDDATTDDSYVCTPGEFVSDQVNEWTNSGLDQLEVADEVGEIVNALMAQLVKQIFESASGLLDFSWKPDDNDPQKRRYFEQALDTNNTTIGPAYFSGLDNAASTSEEYSTVSGQYNSSAESSVTSATSSTMTTGSASSSEALLLLSRKSDMLSRLSGVETNINANSRDLNEHLSTLRSLQTRIASLDLTASNAATRLDAYQDDIDALIGTIAVDLADEDI